MLYVYNDIPPGQSKLNMNTEHAKKSTGFLKRKFWSQLLTKV